MTESELLESADFLAWCGAWERDRHCPLPMADWAMENVGELAFEACVWAHEKEKREMAYGTDSLRPFPRKPSGSKSQNWAWWHMKASSQKMCDDVPVPDQSHQPFHRSFPAAIAYYLTHFDRELAAKHPPK